MNDRQVDGKSFEDIKVNETFSDAVNYCLHVLRRKKYFKNTSNDVMSRQSALLGQKILEILENLRQELFQENSTINNKKSSINVTSRFIEAKLSSSKKTKTNEVISVITLSDSEDETASPADVINIDDDNDTVDVPSAPDCPSTPDSEPADGKDDINTEDDDDDPVHRNLVPYKTKCRVVNLHKDNPSWSIKKLSGHSQCKDLRNHGQLERWVKEIEKYGSRKDWMSKINEAVFKKCTELEKKKQVLSHSVLCKLAIEAKEISLKQKKTPFKFYPSPSWLHSFKSHFNITGPAKNLRINKKRRNEKSKNNENANVEPSNSSEDPKRPSSEAAATVADSEVNEEETEESIDDPSPQDGEDECTDGVGGFDDIPVVESENNSENMDGVTVGQAEDNVTSSVNSRAEERVNDPDNTQEEANKSPAKQALGLDKEKENCDPAKTAEVTPEHDTNNKENTLDNKADKRETVTLQNIADKEQVLLKTRSAEKEKIKLNGTLVNREKENSTNISVNQQKESLNNICANHEKENSNNILINQEKENSTGTLVNQQKENLKTNFLNEKTKNSTDPVFSNEKENSKEELDKPEKENLAKESPSINSNHEEILDLTMKRKEAVPVIAGQDYVLIVKEEMLDEQYEIYDDYAVDSTYTNQFNCAIQKQTTETSQHKNVLPHQSMDLDLPSLPLQQKNVVDHQEKNNLSPLADKQVQPENLSMIKKKENVRIKRERVDDSLEENESLNNTMDENIENCLNENETPPFKTPRIYSVRSLASEVFTSSRLAVKRSVVPPAKRIKTFHSTNKNDTTTKSRVSGSILTWLKSEDFGSSKPGDKTSARLSGTVEDENGPVEKTIDENTPRTVINQEEPTDNKNFPKAQKKRTSTVDKLDPERNSRVPSLGENKKIAQGRVSDTCRDKYRKINAWVYERCKEYKNQGYRISLKILRGWALEAKRVLIYHDLNFHATPGWIKNFQKTYNITGTPDNLIVND